MPCHTNRQKARRCTASAKQSHRTATKTVNVIARVILTGHLAKLTRAERTQTLRRADNDTSTLAPGKTHARAARLRSFSPAKKKPLFACSIHQQSNLPQANRCPRTMPAVSQPVSLIYRALVAKASSKFVAQPTSTHMPQFHKARGDGARGLGLPFGLVGQQGGQDVVGTLSLLRPLLAHQVVGRDGVVQIVYHALALYHLLLQNGLRERALHTARKGAKMSY